MQIYISLEAYNDFVLSDLQELGITEIYCSWQCTKGDPVSFYFRIIHGFIILIIFGISLFVAILSHTVKMKVLNDSRWIAALVYIGVPFVILFTVTFAIEQWLHISAVIYCMALFLSSSIFLSLIFIPKVRYYYPLPAEVVIILSSLAMQCIVHVYALLLSLYTIDVCICQRPKRREHFRKGWYIYPLNY